MSSLMILVVAIALLAFILSIVYLNLLHPFICMIECVRTSELSGTGKALWLLATVLLWSTGSVLYGLFGTHSRRLRANTVKSFAICLLSCGVLFACRGTIVEMSQQYAAGMDSERLGELSELSNQIDLQHVSNDSLTDSLGGFDDFNADQVEENSSQPTFESVMSKLQKLREKIDNVKFDSATTLSDDDAALPLDQQQSVQPEPKVTKPEPITYPGESKLRTNPFATQATGS